MIEWCKELCEESETVPEAVMIIECGSWSLPNPVSSQFATVSDWLFLSHPAKATQLEPAKGGTLLDSDQTALGHPARSVRAWRLRGGSSCVLRPPQATRCFEELRVLQCQNDFPGPEED